VARKAESAALIAHDEPFLDPRVGIMAGTAPYSAVEKTYPAIDHLDRFQVRF
jgi:hypothetical protein